MKTLIQKVSGVGVDEASLSSYEQVLMNGLYELEDIERKAIFLRFWSPSSIEQVSIELKISWDMADKIINRSIEKLRTRFVKADLSSSPFKESRNK